MVMRDVPFFCAINRPMLDRSFYPVPTDSPLLGFFSTRNECYVEKFMQPPRWLSYQYHACHPHKIPTETFDIKLVFTLDSFAM